MSKIAELEKRVKEIESRNHKVESDKGWETSWTRKFVIVSLTYFSIALYLKMVVGIEPWINAVVPALGFLLSTVTFSFFKHLWKRYLYRG